MIMKFDSVYPKEKPSTIFGSAPVSKCWPSEGAAELGSVTGAGGSIRCPAPISRLRVEKIEGGLMVAGVVVAANCQLALPAFGFLFMLVGCVLTAASYRGPAEDEEPDHYAARIAFTGNSRVLGPALIVVGALMLAAGLCLCLLTRRARRRERRVGYHCPVHGDFYPLSPVSGSRAFEGKQPFQWGLCWRGGGDAGPLASSAPPQCPHSTLSSTRSSLSSTPASPCPTPLPFLVTSGSVRAVNTCVLSSSGMVPSVGANLSPDQTFGSIRSLSVSREVASFPLSRTPSPPPGSERLLSPTLPGSDESVKLPPISCADPVAATQPEITVVAPASPPTTPASPALAPSENTTTGSTARPPRKSVSIVLPDEDKG